MAGWEGMMARVEAFMVVVFIGVCAMMVWLLLAEFSRAVAGLLAWMQ